MPPVIPQALAAQQGPQGAWQPQPFVDPYEEERKALQARIDALANAPGMYSPEQVQQRQEQNQRDYQLGLLGMLSENQGLQGAGGQVLKQAMSQREPKTTERGTYDPISGKWTYSPEYQREHLQAQVDRSTQLSAAARQSHDQHTSDQLLRQSLVGQKGEPLVEVQQPDGSTVYMPRSQAAGKAAPPKTSNNATADERLAAGFSARMNHATTLLDQLEKSGGTPTLVTNMVGAVPAVGGYLRAVSSSTTQQQYRQAQEDWVRAKLRKESGANIPPKEMDDEIRTYFPQPGENDPKIIEQKRQSRLIANRAMEAAIGRASAVSTENLGGTGSPAPAGGQPRIKVSY